MSTTFDLQGQHQDKAYQILSSLITPRPIAWVTTLNEDGSTNAAPFSFFNCFGSRPPLVVFAPGNREPGVPKDTARNIRRHRQFVIHTVDASVMHAMNDSAAPHPYGVSEVDLNKLTLTPSETIDVPRITEAPVALECSEHSCIEIGANRLVLGIVQRVHVREGLMDPTTAKLNTHAYAPIGRMASPNWYCTTDALFELIRP
ncbi:flavin reductase family protein [Rubritalea tangerina]|uniref:Flavin reductase family protein n=1 Tax=Rubritalea tangerina TaxID=430798 RepID=A0ABW4ZF45_9BACT